VIVPVVCCCCCCCCWQRGVGIQRVYSGKMGGCCSSYLSRIQINAAGHSHFGRSETAPHFFTNENWGNVSQHQHMMCAVHALCARCHGGTVLGVVLLASDHNAIPFVSSDNTCTYRWPSFPTPAFPPPLVSTLHSTYPSHHNLINPAPLHFTALQTCAARKFSNGPAPKCLICQPKAP
jgi:hypothetical protein